MLSLEIHISFTNTFIMNIVFRDVNLSDFMARRTFMECLGNFDLLRLP